MGAPIRELTNMKFGKLTVLYFTKCKGGYAHWLCECECGQYKEVRGHSLINNNTKSCGCIRGTSYKIKNTKNFAVIDGVKMTFREIEKKYGIGYQTLRYRFNQGMRGNMLIKEVQR